MLTGQGKHGRGEEGPIISSRPPKVTAQRNSKDRKDTMMVYSTGSRNEVSNSLLYKWVAAGPWLLVSGELCGEGCVQARENVTARK